MKTYQKIQAAYQLALANYNDLVKEQRRILESSPPRLLMDIIRDQVIQSAIALFTKTTEVRNTDMNSESTSRDFNARYAQFLRNAFDWEGMAIELFQELDDNLTKIEGQSELLALFSSATYFLDFLKAKQARLMLSVKPDYARTLLLAFRTGEIWPCEDDVSPCTSHDMNIVNLLLEQRRSPSTAQKDQWTITLPTEMIALSRQDPFL